MIKLRSAIHCKTVKLNGDYMEKYISREEFERTIEEISKSMFTIDVCIEVLAEHYCLANKKEFENLCNDVAERRIELQKRIKARQMNELEKYSKKEE